MIKRVLLYTSLIHLTLTSFDALSQSVLSQGAWFKVGVTKEGVYKIDRSLLEEMGLDPASIDPKNVAIYGNGHAGMLPQPNNIERPILQEYAIHLNNESSGSFGPGDFILFYAHGPDRMNYDQLSDRFDYEKNHYVDSTANYFITIKNNPSKRITGLSTPVTSSSFQDTFQKFQVYEDDQVNFISSGRNWYGARFSNGTSRDISFDPSGIVNGSDVKLFYSVLSRSRVQTSFDFSLNENPIGSQLVNQISAGDYQDVATIASDTILVGGVSQVDALDITLTFNNTDATAGHLDYLAVQTTNQLDLQHSPFTFNLEGANTAFEVVNESANWIWDITDEANVSAIQLTNNRFEALSSSSKYYAFDPSMVQTPYYEGEINNQNISAIGAVDVLYITNSSLLSEAERLANHRAEHDGLTVRTVTEDQIFNEFSVGQRDATAIRDFIKHVYDQGGQQLKYVLMFGDGSYAYRLNVAKGDNMVTVYSSRNSIHELESYSSDDYYGFLEDHEGEWDESGDGRAGDHTLEIGIGRLPVKTLDQAKDVVNKIIRYETSQYTFGNWRNKIIFVADDGDSNIHQRDAELLSTYVDTTRNQFIIDKLYIDAFPQDGNSSELASQAFVDAVTNGNLIINYIGHGNESRLTLEGILTQNMIRNFDNRLRLPFIVTATCQIGKYDDYASITAGEELILKGDGGAIGLLTSTRSVFSNSNYTLNEAFYFAAMEKQGGRFLRLGDIFKNAKNNSLEGFRNRNYSLLADPSMRLSFPQQEVVLQTINGHSVDQADTLKALGNIEMTGQIRDQGMVDSDFNGVVTVTVFDKPSAFKTLNNEGTGARTYGIQDVLLFQGDATVTNGQFSIEFVVPKNISYNYGEGKISFYALDETNEIDANGSFSDVIIGGSIPEPPEDNTPPTIELFLDDTTFVNGDRVKPSPVLLARLFDENGINLSRTGFGYDISYVLDGGEPLAINEYYTAERDNFQQGWVTFPINNIEVGKHELQLTVYDIYNNEANQTIEFYVTDKNEIEISNLINYPNPMRFGRETTIQFDHDRPGDNLDVTLSIINFRGREIIRNTYRFEDSSPQSEIVWDGTDAGGNSVKPGIYIYRLLVQSELDGSTSILSQKLVVSN